MALFPNWPQAQYVLANEIAPKISFYVSNPKTMDGPNEDDALKVTFFAAEDLESIPKEEFPNFAKGQGKFSGFMLNKVGIREDFESILGSPVNIPMLLAFQDNVRNRMRKYDEEHTKKIADHFMECMGF